MKKLKVGFLCMLLFAILGYALGFVLNFFVLKKASGEWTDALTDQMPLIFLGVGAFGGILAGLFTKNKNFEVIYS